MRIAHSQWKEEEADVEIKEIVRRAQSLEPVQVKLVSDLSRRNPFYSGRLCVCVCECQVSRTLTLYLLFTFGDYSRLSCQPT